MVHRIIAVPLAVALAAAPSLAQSVEVTDLALRPPPDDGPHALAYVESSDGLFGQPLLDGGRTELELGDLDADGHPDVVMVGDHGSPFVNTQQHGVTVWFGDGQGGWTLGQSGDFGYGGVALGDVNADGHMDVAYGVHHDWSATDLGDQILEVALGDGSGLSWSPWDDGLATNGETWGMFGTDLGDVDGDGDLDVASNSFGCCAGVHVYLNRGNGSWLQSFGFLGGNSNMDLAFADVDGDGHLDVTCSNSDGAVWRGDGQGGFVAAEGNLPLGSFPRGVTAGDVDGDGADELAFLSGGAPQVWSWGPGNQWTPRNEGLPVSGPFELLQLADLDVDGKTDLLAFGTGQVTIYRGDGAGHWEEVLSFPTPGASPGSAEALRTGVDVDHNGYPDIALVQDVTVGIFNSRNEARFFREASRPSTLAAHVLAPGAGRRWRGGQVRFVDWTCAAPGGDLGAVDVAFSSTGPGGPWTDLAQARPNNGRVQLLVPEGVDSAACHVRVTVTTATDAVSAVGPAFVVAP